MGRVENPRASFSGRRIAALSTFFGIGICAVISQAGPPVPSASSLPDGLMVSPPRLGPAVHELEEGQSACAKGMMLVEGEYCPGLMQNCLEWNENGVKRCQRWDKEPKCVGKAEKRRYCMDRYEYPNLLGVRPVVMADWYDALAACEVEGKRLCLESEWNFACEGNERLGYPYGYERDNRACNMDRPRPYPEPDFDAFGSARKVAYEVIRLDMRVESGILEGCVSPFGVHDMTGNVDEWVIHEEHFTTPAVPGKKGPFISGLKGGYWGPIRAACRPVTTAHNELFFFYQVGFRCCADAKDKSDGVARGFVQKMNKWKKQNGALW